MHCIRAAGLMLLLCAAMSLAAAQGILVNPSFEELDPQTGFPVGWEPMFWSNPRGVIEAAEVAHTGERSIALRGIPEDQITDAGRRNNHLVAQSVEIAGMRRLTLRVHARTEGDGRAYLSMMTRDAEGNRLQYSATQRYRLLEEWEELVWGFTTDRDTARLQVLLRNEGAGTVYFDDVSLTSPEDVLDSGPVAGIVDALIGGRISSLKVIADQRETTPWRGVAPGGLTAMIVPGDTYPGVLRDLPWEMEVIEPNRRLALRREITDGDLAGLTFDKTLSMAEGSATVRCDVTVRNDGQEARTLNLRTQDCLQPGHTTFTWPTERGLRVYHHPQHILKRAVEIEDLAGDWMAATDAEGNGMLLRFDARAAEKGYLYLSHELDTMEVYYRPAELAPGETWSTTYSLTPITGAGGVVYADDEFALSLLPLRLRADTDYAVVLHALVPQVSRQITMRGTMQDGDVEAFEDTFAATAAQASQVGLPWAGITIVGVELEVEGLDAPIVITRETLDDSPLRDLPEPPTQVTRFPALEGIFPYGEYYRGYIDEIGPVAQYRRDQLDTYRRSFFNTWLISEHILLNQFARTGESSIVEKLRERDMRLFMRGEYLRVFERTEAGGIRREIYPGDYTRETAIERIERGEQTLDRRRRFAEQFGDVILAYDVSDEPGPEHIHNYMMVQSIFHEIDPHHPAVVILNFNRTEYLPYMPVYYGDEYPIRNTGRNPWMVMDVVQFASERGPGPVWLMGQAFGGLPQYTWHLPTGPEMRLMLWGAIAGGCTGITFHGSFSPPNWRVNNYYFTTAIDSLGATTPCWEAMVDVGRHITAIGPAMLDCAVDRSDAFTIECEQLEDFRGRYTGPAVRLGVLRKPGPDGGRFLVAVNQDLDEARTARLAADPAQIADDAVMVDLHDMTAPTPARAGHELTLEPGDGRMFFAGTRAQAEQIMAAARAGHEANLGQIFLLDARIARANGVDTAAAEALSEQGRSGEAIEALAQAEGMGVVLQRLERLEEALALLTPIAHTFRENWDVVVPPADREGVARGATWHNTQDPQMQQYSDEVMQAFVDRIMLTRRVHAGEAAEVGADVEALVERAGRLNAEAIPYVRERAGDAWRATATDP